MQRYRHLMLDLETLNTTPQSPILSVGACWFGRDGVNERDTFYRVVRAESIPGVVSASTVAWWMQQSDAARAVFNDPGAVEHACMLEEFILFLENQGPRDGSLRVWSHGAGFDVPIMEHAFRAHRLPAPWDHRTARDVRTMIELAGVRVEHFVQPTDSKHNALMDAVTQARAVVHAVNSLPSPMADRVWRDADLDAI